jgi:hypothetical protein
MIMGLLIWATRHHNHYHLLMLLFDSKSSILADRMAAPQIPQSKPVAPVKQKLHALQLLISSVFFSTLSFYYEPGSSL